MKLLILFRIFSILLSFSFASASPGIVQYTHSPYSFIGAPGYIINPGPVRFHVASPVPSIRVVPVQVAPAIRLSAVAGQAQIRNQNDAVIIQGENSQNDNFVVQDPNPTYGAPQPTRARVITPSVRSQYGEPIAPQPTLLRSEYGVGAAHAPIPTLVRSQYGVPIALQPTLLRSEYGPPAAPIPTLVRSQYGAQIAPQPTRLRSEYGPPAAPIPTLVRSQYGAPIAPQPTRLRSEYGPPAAPVPTQLRAQYGAPIAPQPTLLRSEYGAPVPTRVRSQPQFRQNSNNGFNAQGFRQARKQSSIGFFISRSHPLIEFRLNKK